MKKISFTVLNGRFKISNFYSEAIRIFDKITGREFILDKNTLCKQCIGRNVCLCQAGMGKKVMRAKKFFALCIENFGRSLSNQFKGFLLSHA